MHYLVCILLLATGAMAHYRKYDFNNLIERDEPEDDSKSELVPCPACGYSEGYDEKCTVLRNGKWFKKCRHGTYINKCGQMDCRSGFDEICFNDRDMCATSYTCVKNRCVGYGSSEDINNNYFLQFMHHVLEKLKSQTSTRSLRTKI